MATIEQRIAALEQRKICNSDLSTWSDEELHNLLGEMNEKQRVFIQGLTDDQLKAVSQCKTDEELLNCLGLTGEGYQQLFKTK